MRLNFTVNELAKLLARQNGEIKDTDTQKVYVPKGDGFVEAVARQQLTPRTLIDNYPSNGAHYLAQFIDLSMQQREITTGYRVNK